MRLYYFKFLLNTSERNYLCFLLITKLIKRYTVYLVIFHSSLEPKIKSDLKKYS